MKILVRQMSVEDAARWKDAIPLMQAAVFTMAGGGLLGRFAATNPAEFYLDTRVSRRPYSATKILTACANLAQIAKLNGLDPRRLPDPSFHNLGVF